MTRLAAKNLVRSYRGRRVVDDVSFDVGPGEIVGLLGPNGAGKSTSFHMVVGLVDPEAGEVRLGDRAITGLPLHQRARLGVGYLPQEPSIFRGLSVVDNLLAILELSEPSPSARTTRAKELLTEFELLSVANTLGGELSGGERRRVEIARALIPRPRFLLFDEPFAGVDPLGVSEVQRLIAQLAARGIGVLLTDHQVRETLGICHRAYLLVNGRIVEAGAPAELAASSQARETYLGRSFKLN